MTDNKKPAGNDSTKPTPLGSVICQRIITLGFLLITIALISFSVDHLHHKIPSVLSDGFDRSLIRYIGLLIVITIFAVILWRRKQSNKVQVEESDGGLLWLEWVLKNQIKFLTGSIVSSFIVTLFFVVCLILLIFAIPYPFKKGPSDAPYTFTDIPVFSLALIVASVTFAVTLWRGYQTYEQIRKAQEQIDKAQEQNEGARFQKAVELGTDKHNPGRCISGLRTLEDMHDKVSETDKQTIYSAALYVLSISKEVDSKGKVKKVSSSARQKALDILVNKEFLAQKRLEESNKEKGGGLEIPIRYSTTEKDFSRLHFVRRSKSKDSKGNKILDLSGFSFRGCNFFAANLSGVNFEGANFSKARAEGVNLSGTTLKNIKDKSGICFALAYYYDKEYGKPMISGNPQIKPWEKWKTQIKLQHGRSIKRIRKINNAKKLEQWEWDYLVDLAVDNLPHPPRVYTND